MCKRIVKVRKPRLFRRWTGSALLLLGALFGDPGFARADDPGFALRFDGESDYVVLGSTASMMDPAWQGTKSVTLWVKPMGSPSCTAEFPTHCDAVFGDKPRTWGISRGVIGDSDRLWVWNYDENVDSIGIEYAAGEWIQIALVHDGGTLSAYKNGVFVGSVPSGSTSDFGLQGVLHLGGVINSASRNWTFDGEIDEVRIWNTARSAAEIGQDMNRSLTGSESGLAAYYKMSDGSGSSLTDDSGHGWTGTLHDGGSGVPADGPITWVPSGAFGGGGNPGNSVPVADDQSVTTAEDTPVGIVLTGSDADGDGLTFQIVTPPAQGSLTGTAPDVTYTPALDFNGADSFSFVVNDGVADSTTATVTLTVTLVNDPPVAVADTASTIEDTPVVVDVLGNDSDVDGDELTVTAVGLPANGTAHIDAGGVLYTPDSGFTGSDSFSYTIGDGNGGVAESQVTVEITGQDPDNNVPVAHDQSVTTAEDTPVGIVLTGSDADGDGLTFQIVTPPGQGSLTGTAPDVTYTPAPDFNGADSFSFVVNDGLADSAPATVTLVVTPVNDAPEANDDTAATSVDTPVFVDVLGNDADVDGDELTVNAVGPPANGTAGIDTGGVLYTPDPGFTGSDSFTYTIADGNGGTADGQVTVDVAEAGEGAGYALRFDGVSDFVVLAETFDMLPAGWQDTKTVSLWVKPTGTPFCTIPFAANCDAIFGDRPRWWGISRGVVGGSDRIWVWNWDGNMDVVGVDYTPGEWVHIAMVHDQGTLSVYANGVLVGSVLSGSTQQPITGASPVLHLGGILINATNNWTFEGELDEVRIWHTARSAAEIVQDMNRSLSGTEPGLAAYYKMSDGLGSFLTDDSGHGWTGTLHDGGGGVPADGPILWVASGAFGDGGGGGGDGGGGDGGGGGGTNTAPVADPQSLETAEENALTIHLTGSDADGDALAFSIVSSPGHGSLTGAAPDLNYTPSADYNGPDSFSFVANDGQTNSAPATVAIVITPVNDPPEANDDAAVTSAGTPVDVAVLGNDSDPEGDVLTIVSVGVAGNGTVVNNGDSVTYTPDAGYVGNDTFSYTVSDPSGSLASALVAITVGDSGNPIEIGAYDTPGRAHDLVVVDGYAYVADFGGGLQIADATDPTAPFQAGSLATSGGAVGVSVAGEHAYVANGLNGLRVVNIADPGNPFEVGYYDTAGFAQDVEVEGSLAFVADREGGVSIIDVSNPANPVEIGFYLTPDQALEVAIAGDRAFVAANGAGLLILDISDPSRPLYVGQSSGHLGYGVTTVGGIAYVAAGGSGLRVLDVSDPAFPREIGFFDTPGFAQRVAVSGNYAYVADWTEGLRVVDVSLPSSPVDAGFYESPGRTRDVVVVDGYVYIADFEAGLRILVH